MLNINGVPLNNSSDLEYALQFAGSSFEVEFLSGDNKIFKRKIIRRQNFEKLGLIIVPDSFGHSYLEISKGESLFKKIFRWHKK